MGTSRGPNAHDLMADEEWQSWTAVLMLNRTVLQRLDARFRAEHRLSVTEFDVLITLFNAEDQRVRMSELADRALLSPAGTTHLVTRLERDGLVRREVDPGDGRKWFTVLTDAGDELLRQARRTHNEVLRETFLAATTASERRALQRMWRRLAHM